jgi:hypothetical protein
MTYHSGDPLASVDSSVEDNSRLGSLASTSPDVDTSQSPTLERVSKSKDLRAAGVRSLQVGEELEMISVGVVGGEPRLARNCAIISIAVVTQIVILMV